MEVPFQMVKGGGNFSARCGCWPQMLLVTSPAFCGGRFRLQSDRPFFGRLIVSI